MPRQIGLKSRNNYRLKHDLLVNKVILSMSESGLCKCWSQPTGAAYRDGELIHYGIKGSADISGILTDGRRLEVEIKTGRAVQQKNQETFERMILKMGGVYFVARSVEDALQKLKAVATGSKL